MKLQRKNKIQYLILVLLLFVIILSLYFFYNPFNIKSKQAAQTNTAGEYVIGVYQDKIAVFTQGDTLPIEIYDVYVGTLPILDQKELKKGIKVNGGEELKQRIEDYTS